MLSKRRSKPAVNDVLLTLSLTWAGAEGIFTSKRGARVMGDVSYKLFIIRRADSYSKIFTVISLYNAGLGWDDGVTNWLWFALLCGDPPGLDAVEADSANLGVCRMMGVLPATSSYLPPARRLAMPPGEIGAKLCFLNGEIYFRAA
jgi:hypothetical protein